MKNKDFLKKSKQTIKEKLYLEMLQQNLQTLNSIEILIFHSDKNLARTKKAPAE